MDLETAAYLAHDLMTEHQLIRRGWAFGFDNAVRRAGQCSYRNQKITLSRSLTQLHPDHEVRDTILHEIAHALAGPNTHHGPRWKTYAILVGAKPTRCYESNLPAAPHKFVGVCANDHKVKRHRLPGRLISCIRCHPSFHYDHLFTWYETTGKPAKMPPNYLKQYLQLVIKVT